MAKLQDCAGLADALKATHNRIQKIEKQSNAYLSSSDLNELLAKVGIVDDTQGKPSLADKQKGLTAGQGRSARARLLQTPTQEEVADASSSFFNLKSSQAPLGSDKLAAVKAQLLQAMGHDERLTSGLIDKGLYAAASFGAQLSNNGIPAIRALGALMAERNTGGFTKLTVDSVRDAWVFQAQARIGNSITDQYSAWLKANNLGSLKSRLSDAFTQTSTKAFYREVKDAYLKGDFSSSTPASKVARSMNEYQKYRVENGLPEGSLLNLSPSAIATAQMNYGEEAIYDLIKEALRKGGVSEPNVENMLTGANIKNIVSNPHLRQADWNHSIEFADGSSLKLSDLAEADMSLTMQRVIAQDAAQAAYSKLGLSELDGIFSSLRSMYRDTDAAHTEELEKGIQLLSDLKTLHTGGLIDSPAYSKAAANATAFTSTLFGKAFGLSLLSEAFRPIVFAGFKGYLSSFTRAAKFHGDFAPLSSLRPKNKEEAAALIHIFGRSEGHEAMFLPTVSDVLGEQILDELPQGTVSKFKKVTEAAQQGLASMSRASNLMNGLRLGSRAISGMTERGVALRLTDILQGGVSGTAKKDFLRAMQWTEADLTELKKVASFVEVDSDGVTAKYLDVTKLDPEMRLEVQTALTRVAKRANNRAYAGTTTPFMSKAAGRIIMQYRNHMFTSIERMLGYDFNPNAASQQYMASMAFLGLMGGASYTMARAVYDSANSNNFSKTLEEKMKLDTFAMNSVINSPFGGAFGLTASALNSGMTVLAPKSTAGAREFLGKAGAKPLGLTSIPTLGAIDKANRGVGKTVDSLIHGDLDAVAGQLPNVPVIQGVASTPLLMQLLLGMGADAE